MRLSLFQRIAFGGLLPAAAMLIGFAGFLLIRSHDLIVEQRDRDLKTQGRDRVLAIDTFLQNAARPVRRTAQLGYLQPEMPTKDYWQWLASVLDDNPTIYGAGITFWPANRDGKRKDLYTLRGKFGNVTDGKYYYQDESFSYDGTDGSHDWFSIPQRLGKPLWSAPYFDQGAGNVWMVSYSVPFFRRPDNVFDGVALTDVNLSALHEIAKDTGHFDNHFAVIDLKGQFVLHNDPQLIGKSTSGWAQCPKLAALLSQDPATDGVTFAVNDWPGIGPAWVVKFSVPNTDWVILSTIPDQSLWAGMGPSELLSTAVLLGALLLMIASTLYITRHYTRPVSELTRAVHALRKDGQHTPLRYYGSDEMGQLADAFRLMRTNIADRDRSLREANAQLEMRVAHRTHELQTLEARLRRIANTIPCTVFQMARISAGEFRYDYVSDAVETHFGISAAKVTENFSLALAMLHLEDFPAVYECVETAAKNRSDYTAEFRMRHGVSHQLMWVRTSACYVGEENGLPVWNGYHIDISQSKAMQLEILQAKAESEAASEAKSHFLASMSHELRTPMNAVIGLADLTLQTTLSSQQRGWIAKISRSANNLMRLLNDVLDFSKLEAGKMELEQLQFEMPLMMHSVLDLVADQAKQKGLTLDLNIGCSVPVLVIGDALRLSQVLINFASNAVKFTTTGTITLGVSASGHTADSVQLRFWVQDTGIGISSEVKERLFTAFTQADASTTRRYGGSGLGLAICREIISLMNGYISIESTLNVGSTFSIDVRMQLPFSHEGDGDALEYAPEYPSWNPISADAQQQENSEEIQAEIESLTPQNRDTLFAQLDVIDQQLAVADSDAVDAWDALTDAHPWLLLLPHGIRAQTAFSSYQFLAARTELQGLKRGLT